MKPIVHLYTICWNEEKIIPYFINHYKDFVDKFFIYDNESTDSTIELLSKYDNVEIKTYESGNQIRDDIYLKIKNNEWKKSKGVADFVIVCDMDEFLYHENMIEYLIDMKKNNYTLSKVLGFEMITEKFNFNYDYKLTELLKEGIYTHWFNKLCIFNPNKIDEINYSPGCHGAKPIGDVSFTESELKLLHYKNLGLEYALDKLIKYKNRISELNKKMKWGSQYNADIEDAKKFFYKMLNDSKKIIT